ncbi:hypothetical protein [Pseudomonas retamae]|uniref:Uncharacterized protein n=1 Tax=Pseudomonas retamae TaxID=702110 RepID=A0ABW7D510_9PSED
MQALFLLIGYQIEREFISLVSRVDFILRLRIQLASACSGCRTAASTPATRTEKSVISAMLSCENMVGNSCSHYVGSRRLDAFVGTCGERMFIFAWLDCATGITRGAGWEVKSDVHRQVADQEGKKILARKQAGGDCGVTARTANPMSACSIAVI